MLEKSQFATTKLCCYTVSVLLDVYTYVFVCTCMWICFNWYFILFIHNRDFGKWEKYTTGFGSKILAKVCTYYIHSSKMLNVVILHLLYVISLLSWKVKLSSDCKFFHHKFTQEYIASVEKFLCIILYTFWFNPQREMSC